MSSPSPIAIAIQSIRSANDYELKKQELDELLRPLLNHAIPRLDQSASVTFIASDLWFGNEYFELETAVNQKCFHADTQSRRIIGVVQAYGCGKTKTGLRLANSFILLPIRFNVGSVGSATLVDDVLKEQNRLLDALPSDPTYQQVEVFSQRCLDLVNMCLLVLVALYDHCIANRFLDGSPRDRFFLALLLLNDHRDVVQWCKDFFQKHKEIVQDKTKFDQFVNNLLQPEEPRPLKIVFLLDEVHVLFDKCRGYCLHKTNTPAADPSRIKDWYYERINGRASAGHRACTDLFYQFRLVMLDYLLLAGAPFGFVMCSTMFRIWKVLEEENSPLSRGTIDQFFRLHWFTHTEIKNAVLSIFNIQEAWLNELEFAPDGSFLPHYKRLSAYGRPLFLMEFLEQLCMTFTVAYLPDISDTTLKIWLRKALAASQETTMQRARDQIETLVTANPSVDLWTARQIVHLLYTTQRLCGGTLELGVSSMDEQTLESIISKGVARLDEKASRFRISDAMFTEALMQRYSSLEAKNEAVLKILNQNTNLTRALISQDSAHKGFLVERLLAWLAISSQLHVSVFNQHADHSTVTWTISCTADCAGTLPELECGKTSADEPPVLAAIMDGSLKRVLLPTTLAGPDLWMRATIDGMDCVVAVQSKMENEVYSFMKFKAALDTLDPIQMYRSAAAARMSWQQNLAQLEAMPYHRIIFSACGFTSEVQFAVREYNRARGREVVAGQPRRFIHLLHLDDIRPFVGLLYGTLKEQFTTAVEPTKGADSFLLSHEWNNLSTSKRTKILVPELHEHCKYRKIDRYWNKRKPQLLDALYVHSTDDVVTARLQQLDPHFT